MQTFAEAVTQLEHVISKMASGVGLDEVQLKRESIEARRQFAARTAEIVKMAEGCPEIAGRPEAIGALRDAMNRMRSVTASHQARFPSVSVNANDPAFRQSAKNVLATFTAFVDCARRILADARQRQAALG